MNQSQPDWIEPHQRFVTTSQAAKALGVHVSTIKRWVDSGVLPATYTAGGHRKILVADILRLHDDQQFPRADLTQLQGQSSRTVQSKSILDMSEELLRAIRAGDGEAIRGVIHGAYQRGCSMAKLADEIIAPTMHRVGHEWASDQLSILHEHRGTQYCVGALYELQGTLRTQGDMERPVAVGGAPEHDHYILPSLLAKMVLLDLGWNAINLGPHTPMEAFEMAVEQFRPQLIWLSSSHIPHPEEFLKGYQRFYLQAEKAGASVVLGGQGLLPSLRTAMSYHAFGDRMENLAAFATRLYAPPKRPRTGRPTVTELSDPSITAEGGSDEPIIEPPSSS